MYWTFTYLAYSCYVGDTRLLISTVIIYKANTLRLRDLGVR